MWMFLILGSAMIFAGPAASAKLNVITTTAALKSLVQEVAGDAVAVESIAKGTQDPHFVESKPSYMVKLRDADLVVAVGLDLEVGWLPLIVRGAKNPKIQPGQPGYLELGDLIEPLGAIQGKVDRSQGDVHPRGNPHYWLDPQRGKQMARGIAARLSGLDTENAGLYNARLGEFEKKIDAKTEEWKERVGKTKIRTVVTYHKSFDYFFDRFGIRILDNIEPKPGIPPSAKHIVVLIEKMRKENVKCILNESYYETSGAERLRKGTDVKVMRVPVDVGAVKGVENYFQLIEKLIESLEECGGGR